MSSQGTIRRYTLIIEKIRRSNFPSFDEIKEYLSSHDFDISHRTLQRDIEQIRIEFGAEIKYHRQQNGYFLDLDTSVNMDSFLRLLEIVATANILTDSLREGKKSLQYISFESDGNLRGIDFLKSILFALKNHRKIKLTYKRFDAEKNRSYILIPLLLKEYQNRWYVHGRLENEDKTHLTFGIDRIEGLEVTTKTFNPATEENPSVLFDNIVGLTYSYGEQEEVELSFTPLQGNYAKSLPLHKSQRILKDNSKELVVSLNIIPNYEFRQKIMMLGDQVKVVKPKWLAKEIKNAHKKSAKRYS